MAIALVGLLAAAVVGPEESMFAGIGDEPLAETLRKSVREARYQAVSTGGIVTLEWSAEDASFIIRNATGAELERIKSDVKLEQDGVTFSRLGPWPGDSLQDGESPESEVSILQFDADRSSTPFIARIHYAGEDSALRFDSFSNLRMEAPDDTSSR